VSRHGDGRQDDDSNPLGPSTSGDDTAGWFFGEDTGTGPTYRGAQEESRPPAATPRPAALPPPPPVNPAAQAAPAQPPGPTPPGTDRPPRRRGAGSAVLAGAFLGVVTLALAWVFVLQSPSPSPSIAVPVRSTPAPVKPSVSPSPTPRKTSPKPTRSASPTPRPTPTPTPVPTPTPTPLNDAANRLGWTFLIDGLGPAKLGMRADDAVPLGVLAALPSECGPHSSTDLLGPTKVIARGDQVVAIDIRSNAFPSSRGYRLGTTLAELQAAYGDNLKPVTVTDGETTSDQWALVNPQQYIAYIVDPSGVVVRIVIGYRQADGNITLPAPC
jgi:hypothetical protein